MLKHKCFLYLTEFFAGMSVMAIELGASRLMAPYFSSSQIVWTVIIGTIMIAMALGNIIGGRLADKNPDPCRLYMRLLIAAVWTAAIPFAGRYLIMGISLLLAAFVKKNFLIWASFATCFIVFVFPLILLGTVTPSLVKFSVNNLDDNGKTVGELGALNTIGSIIGTFVPTFITIPAVGTAATFIIFSSILALISIAYFLSIQKKLIKTAIAAVLIVVFSFTTVDYSFAFWEDTIIHEDESIYNYLQVKDDNSSTILSTNVLFGVQSIMMKNQQLTGMYYDYALAAPIMAGVTQKSDNQLLILGLGTGTYATLCRRYFPDMSIEGVEIDEKIADLASQYFSLPSDVSVDVYDGRSYLNTRISPDKKYDVIMVDAYQDITIPFQMSTIEFFTQVKSHLKENGVMVVNMNMKSKQEGSINDYLCDTISSVFACIKKVPVNNGTNCEVFASDRTDLSESLLACLPSITNISLQAMMRTVANGLTDHVTNNRILTDDKAPVELLGMKVLDEIIQDELDYYRDLYLSGDQSIRELLP